MLNKELKERLQAALDLLNQFPEEDEVLLTNCEGNWFHIEAVDFEVTDGSQNLYIGTRFIE